MNQRKEILGVSVDALTESDLFALVENAILKNKRWIVANHNLHSIYLYHHDEGMRAFYEKADSVLIDGMSIIFVSRLHGLPLNVSHRLTWTDLITSLISTAATNYWRIFFLGSMPGIGDKAGDVFRSSSPLLHYQCRHGYFDTRRLGDENQRIVAQINAFEPDILLVGMGMPRQEKWILENLDDLNCNVVCNVGACMDFVAGAKPLPPRWLGRYGLEWIYRLAREPVRLYRRYLIEPWSLLRFICKK